MSAAALSIGCAGVPADPPGGSLESRYGLTASLPERWYGRMTRGSFVASTSPLAVDSQSVRPALGPSDIVVRLFEASFENTSPPLEQSQYPSFARVPVFHAADFATGDGLTDDSLASGHGFARRSFGISGRAFDVFVESGRLPPSPRALSELNTILASLVVEPGDFYPGSVEPPRFAYRAGWHVADSGPQPVDPDGEFATAWASTIPYRDEWNALPPTRTLERLPADGIVLWVLLWRTNRFPADAERPRVPLQLADFDGPESWEGQVRDIPQRRLWGTLDDAVRLDARVFFGSSKPTAEMLREAQSMLDRLELPDWGAWELER